MACNAMEARYSENNCPTERRCKARWRERAVPKEQEVVVLGVANPGPGLSKGDGRLHHVNFGVNEYVEKQAKNRVRGVAECRYRV